MAISQYLSPMFVRLFAATWVGYLLIHRKESAFFIRILGAAPLAIFLFYLNDPLISFEIKTPKVSIVKDKQKPNVILIGVDSLKQLALNLYKNSDDLPYTRKFLTESTHFEKPIADIGKTQPSLVSILSGKKPHVSGMRENLQKNASDTSIHLDNGVLKEFKSWGYSTRLFLSDADFAFFSPTQTLDVVNSPKPGFQNILLPFYLTDVLLFAWQNNILGKFFFPEVIDNNSYNEIWWSKNFTNRVLKDLNQIGSVSTPTLSLYHNCQLHWPGIARYPFRNPRPISPYINSPFGFENRYAENRLATTYKTDIEYNRFVYEKTALQVAEDYLEPIFKYIYESHLFESSIIVLYSDHGEFLNTPALLPATKNPKHGTLLMAGDDSEYAVLNIHFPSSLQPSIDSKSLINLSDILPLVAHQIEGKQSTFVKKSVTSESSAWVSKLFPGQMYFRNNILSDVDFTDGGFPFVDLQMENFLTKQRAIYSSDGTRYTVYPTRFGFQSWIENPLEEGNVFLSQSNEIKKMHAQFLQDFDLEIKNQTLPDLKLEGVLEPFYFLDWSESMQQLIERHKQGDLKNSWLLFIKSLHVVYRDQQIDTGVTGLNFILSQKDIPKEIQILAQIFLMRWEIIYSFSSQKQQQQLFNFIYPKPASKSLIRLWHQLKLLLFQKYNHKNTQRFLFNATKEYGGSFYYYKTYDQSYYLNLIQEADPYQTNQRLRAWNFFLRSQDYVPKLESDLYNVINSLVRIRLNANVDFHIQKFIELMESFESPLMGVRDPFYLNIFFERFPLNLQLRMISYMGEDKNLDYETLALMEHYLGMDLLKRLANLKDKSISYLLSQEKSLTFQEKKRFMSLVFARIKYSESQVTGEVPELAILRSKLESYQNKIAHPGIKTLIAILTKESLPTIDSRTEPSSAQTDL
ncbi:MAG: DUF229 domain-containing protein [Pseudobdellovibrionaceae bacterium]